MFRHEKEAYTVTYYHNYTICNYCGWKQLARFRGREWEKLQHQETCKMKPVKHAKRNMNENETVIIIDKDDIENPYIKSITIAIKQNHDQDD